MAEITLDQQIACVRREIGMRRSVFGRRVADGRTAKEKADHEITAMEAVLATLEHLQKTQPGAQGSML